MMRNRAMRRIGRLCAVAAVAALAVLPVGPVPVRADDPAPVILVHGLNSSAGTWAPYLGPDGFLAGVGRRGFAVGDGQAPGVLRTGDLTEPFSRTNTIAENAAQLRDYIADVRRQTGAPRVDLVAHSMGGLIARYYIDQLMQDRDVNQLIMLGTPNAGSACAGLPARLGVSVPATLELRPSYLREVFNRQIHRRHGVPFHLLGGNGFTTAIQSPCADPPSDLVVSVTSVEAVGGPAVRVPVMHTDLTGSREVFDTFVAPRLATDTAGSGDPAPDGAVAADVQFVGLAAGRVAPGYRVEVNINIDHVAVATFAIYDPTRSLAVAVRGASGRVIELDPSDNGLITVDDPASLVHLGYGFDNPRPGPWRVTLYATERTPAAGADYAVTAQVGGGAEVTARVDELLPPLGQPVRISARLASGGQPLAARHAVALIRAPDGSAQEVALAGTHEVTGSWRPDQTGVHGIDVLVVGEADDGVVVERTALLAVEVGPEPAAWWRLAAALGGLAVVPLVLAVVVAAGVGAVLWRRRLRQRRT